MNVFYKVGLKIFTNKLLALRESMLSGNFPEFHYCTSSFENVNWSTKIPLSFDALCDIRAHQLRNQHDHLVLAYSGGTDSQTIWETFKRNKIHIDDIVVSYYSKGTDCFKQSMPYDAVSWLRKNHYDSTTNIISVDRSDNVHKTYFSSENWILDDPVNAFSRYEATMSKNSFWLEVDKKYANKNYCKLVGYEKPCVRLENKKWYGYFLDVANYNLMIGDHQLEPFFSAATFPELHIKQSQMLKDYVEHKFRLMKMCPDFWDSRFDADGNQPLLGYNELAQSCGRSHEIFHNLKSVQKTASRNYWTLSPDPNKIKIVSDADVVGLVEDLQQKNPYALNYIKGIYSILNETEFYNWLIDHNWCKPQKNPMLLTGIFSKFFYLGDFDD